MSSNTKKRKYTDSYLRLGFTSIVKNDIELPQCVICGKTLSNESMKPSLLSRHFQNFHANLETKDIEFFKRKETALKKQRLDSVGGFFQQNSGIVRASYEVSLMIAKSKKPHTIGENLILPAAKEIVRCVISEEASKKLNAIPLSNNTVQRRIIDMSNDILQQVISEVKNSKLGFAIQLDETTDVTNYAQLIVFVRYVGDGRIKEELLLNTVLEATTKGEDIFEIVNSFFKLHGLEWEALKGCTSDGAPAMLAVKSGFKARVLEVAPHVIFLHCMIHRFALACKVLPEKLSSVLSQVIKIVNNIKGSALNSRLFKLLCEDFESDHKILLYHANVRWLSRGNVVKRVFELRNELLQFFQCNKYNTCEDFVTSLEDDEFLLKLAYLVDIFEAINLLNQSIQGPDATICDFESKFRAFLAKIHLWKTNAENDTFAMFSTVTEFVEVDEKNIQLQTTTFKELIIDHLTNLEKELKCYFPHFGASDELVYLRSPFTSNPELLPPGSGKQEALIDLQHDEVARDVYSAEKLCTFWVKMLKSYSIIAEPVVKALLIFPSTWLCESTFSVLLGIKTKHRSNLKTTEHDVRCAVSKINPRIDKLSNEKQPQGSH